MVQPLLPFGKPSVWFLVYYFFFAFVGVHGDNYELTSPNHKSLVVAMGCFWCGEEAFERYAPGVIEAVSGYGGGEMEYPTYRNHPGHYEVVLVEYDPTLTSYETLLQYAWKNIDPFNGNGQFCDRGHAYKPVIFYENDIEKIIATNVLNSILEDYPTWNRSDIVVPILERPTFWIAEEYHQDYYIKNPGSYLYYKNGCGRPHRLKQVWGDEAYKCYHDINTTCFDTVTNTNGTEVNVTVNIKEISDSEPAILPKKYWIIIGCCCGGVIVLVIAGYSVFRSKSKESKQ